MSLTTNTGPYVTTGNVNPVQNSEPDAGPSMSFQGSGLVDPRFVGSIGAAPGGKVYGLFANSYVVSTDSIPVALGATRIAAAQAAASGVGLALVTAQGAGVSPAMPVVPMGAGWQNSSAVNCLALDFGFTVCNSTSGLNTFTLPAGAWRLFNKGQRLIIAGAGAGGGNLYTTVSNVPGTNGIAQTVLTTADNAGTSTNGCQVGTAHYTPGVNVAYPYAVAGAVSMPDGNQGITRAVSVTANAGATGGAIVVRGYDVYGAPMSESITAVAGSTVNGKKAFKYVVSATPAFTDAGHTYAVGTTDIMGFNFRADFWEYLNVFVAGTFVAVSTGWTVADATTPATSTTGDVRGTYALQTASNGDGTVANWATSRRAALFGSIPLYNTINANNLNYATLFGSTQA